MPINESIITIISNPIGIFNIKRKSTYPISCHNYKMSGKAEGIIRGKADAICPVSVKRIIVRESSR